MYGSDSPAARSDKVHSVMNYCQNVSTKTLLYIECFFFLKLCLFTKNLFFYF